MRVVYTFGREDDLFKHSELFSAVLTCLVLDVYVAVVIHETDPLNEMVKSLVQSHTASARVIRFVELLVLEYSTFWTPYFCIEAQIGA